MTGMRRCHRSRGTRGIVLSLCAYLFRPGGLPNITDPADQTKSTILLGGSDAYQTLPEYLLAMLKPLVILDWSTNAYHPADLGLDLPRVAFTNLYHRDEGLTTDPDL